jgi:biopolymer transport protein ExbB
MPRRSTAGRPSFRTAAGLALVLLTLASGAAAEANANPGLDAARRQADLWGRRALSWYGRTPPVERITWGGLIACALLGLGVTAGRMARLRRRRIIPKAFVARFRERLADGKLDRAKGLDYCELNPSPAARVALAAIQRWGRPAMDLERAVGLARGREVEALRRNVGTLRRIAGLAPLLGLLGTLTAAGRALAVLGPGSAWGPALAGALAPLTAGVALAILALVAYDGLSGRVESLAGDLDRLGAETVDAIALAAPLESLRISTRADHPAGPPRAPHPIRVAIPEGLANFGNDVQ